MTCDVILEKKECIRYWVVETIIYYFKFRNPTLNDVFMRNDWVKNLGKNLS